MTIRVHGHGNWTLICDAITTHRLITVGPTAIVCHTIKRWILPVSSWVPCMVLHWWQCQILLQTVPLWGNIDWVVIGIVLISTEESVHAANWHNWSYDGWESPVAATGIPTWGVLTAGDRPHTTVEPQLA